MSGWCGRILKIDLATGAWETLRPTPDVYRQSVGGRGLAGLYLEPEVTRRWHDSAMPILLFTGPLVDTASPTASMMTIMSRSPLTGTVGYSSVGGSFGALLKKAGWDGVIVTGKSPRPCGIEIAGENIALTDASGMAGLTTSDIFGMLRGRGAAAVTGPAAENGVVFANVIVDGHYAAGRNGLGLSFAAKNLRYVTTAGHGTTAVADPEGLQDAVDDIDRLLSASPALLGEFGIAEFGTSAFYDLTHARRMMPTDQFRATFFPPAASLNAPTLRERYNPQRTGCPGCPILCKKTASDGRPLPEFETLSHFTALLGNEDLETVVEANRICNEMGMDAISAAATLACHAEIEGGRLDTAEILDLLEGIGRGRGIGAELGWGSAAYAASRGCPECSVTVKGQELSAYDPRGACGIALAYAMSTCGGSLPAALIALEILRKPVVIDRMSFSGKARIVKIAEDQNAAIDSLSVCECVLFSDSLEVYAKAFRTVTGVPATARDLLKIGERIVYRERMMNARNGFTAADDDLPGRFFTMPGSAGNHISMPAIDRRAFLEARARYFAIRGLDERGMPAKAKAEKLGIAWKN